MATKNLLAIIRPGDEEHHLLKAFYASLPSRASVVHESPGFLGNLDNYLGFHFGNEPQRDRRIFVICRDASLADVDTEYFSTHLEACVNEIPDELALSKVYTAESSVPLRAPRPHELAHKGPILPIVKEYRRLLSLDPREVFDEDLRRVDDLEAKVEKKFFGIPLDKTKPTHVTISLETSDERYLIGAQTKGPFTLDLA